MPIEKTALSVHKANADRAFKAQRQREDEPRVVADYEVRGDAMARRSEELRSQRLAKESRDAAAKKPKKEARR